MENKAKQKKFLFPALAFPTSGLESLHCLKLCHWHKTSSLHKLPLSAILTVSSLNCFRTICLKSCFCLFAFLEDGTASLCSPSIHASAQRIKTRKRNRVRFTSECLTHNAQEEKKNLFSLFFFPFFLYFAYLNSMCFPPHLHKTIIPPARSHIDAN